MRSNRKSRKNKNDIISVILLMAVLVGVILLCLFFFMKSNESIEVIKKEEVENTSESEVISEVQNNTDEEKTDEDINENANRVDDILSSMSLEEKINQLFFITPEALTNVEQVVAAGETTKNALKEHPVGGIIYFTQNITGEDQLKEMLENTKKLNNDMGNVPLFIGIDEEGGTVARLGNSENVNVPYVGNMADIGRSGDIQKAYDAGNIIGKYLSEYGFNMDFAPDADVLTNNENAVVKDRSFGSDPEVVAEMALQVSKGLNDNGIYSCFKHFPGHGATKDDTHEGFAFADKSYDELINNEIVPFKKAVDSGADFIMIGHFALPNVTGDNTPASISSVIINDILKGDMGYKGIVITDSLSMKALTELYGADKVAVEALKAGVDMLLMPENFNEAYNAVLNGVKSGEISEERINESVKKIISVKLKKLESEFSL